MGREEVYTVSFVFSETEELEAAAVMTKTTKRLPSGHTYEELHLIKRVTGFQAGVLYKKLTGKDAQTYSLVDDHDRSGLIDG